MSATALVVLLAALAQDPAAPTPVPSATDQQRLDRVRDRRAALEKELARMRGEE